MVTTRMAIYALLYRTIDLVEQGGFKNEAEIIRSFFERRMVEVEALRKRDVHVFVSNVLEASPGGFSSPDGWSVVPTVVLNELLKGRDGLLTKSTVRELREVGTRVGTGV